MPKLIKIIISFFALSFTILTAFCLKEFTIEYSSFKLLPSIIFINASVSSGIFKIKKSHGLLFSIFILINLMHAYGLISMPNEKFVILSFLLGLFVAIAVVIEIIISVKKRNKN